MDGIEEVLETNVDSQQEIIPEVIPELETNVELEVTPELEVNVEPISGETNTHMTYNQFGTILANAEVKLSNGAVLISDKSGYVQIPVGASFTSEHVVK